MRLLLFYTHDFWLKPFRQNLDGVEETEQETETQEAVLALVHAEPEDTGREGKVVTKAIKNIKWVAGKFDSKRVVLHYFAHLGKESAQHELAREMVESMRERLEKSGYEVHVTPYGYFNEFKLHVAGESLGKVFVEI
ncbi:MAG: threonyl-tRNA synthetase editing domain-containing protein [Verrucomicrobiales bacterium]|nr:threonyl-tRNA synthetase editing domain-containing protein [Verrucomicrobiales bacterium]